MQCKPFTSLFLFFLFLFFFLEMNYDPCINVNRLKSICSYKSFSLDHLTHNDPTRGALAKRQKTSEVTKFYVTLLQLSIGCRCSFSYPPNPLNKRTSSIRVKRRENIRHSSKFWRNNQSCFCMQNLPSFLT